MGLGFKGVRGLGFKVVGVQKGWGRLTCYVGNRACRTVGGSSPEP